MADEKGPPCCILCNLSFTRTSHLKRQSRLHEDRGSYQCVCGRLFSRNDGLARHLRRSIIAQQDNTILGEFDLINSTKQT
ncbi:hypothetical protein BJX66DRAFT_319332 [Aspergillus keveii]|uniref:C2H2-type domain-containing protein n=1 Tax=Aspergillus keveii TaxID=714993 RepID=A0ABR4FIE2_9EURO